MRENHIEDFIALLKIQKEDIPFLEYRVKDFHAVAGIVLTIMNSGAIPIILNVLGQWSRKHYNTTIRISYESVNGEHIEVTHSQLSKKDTEDMLLQHPPITGSKFNIQFPGEGQMN